MKDALHFEPLLFREIGTQAAEQAHDALPHLVVVGDNTDELSTRGACENTDNDSERSTAAPSSRKRAPPISSKVTATKCNSNQKKHKRSTCIVRKEEKNKLLQELESLQERLRHLEAQQNASPASLTASTRNNAFLRESVGGQQLSFATSQCAVSTLLNGEHLNPLSTNYICLGIDWDDRRRTLLAMKKHTIRHACEYVEARSRFLNPLKRHDSEERFETARGDSCCAQFDVQQFTNVTSVKQVYDALVSYLLDIEISVSERLGDITTRDDLDSVENSIAGFRFLSTVFGVPMEKHGVLFMEYFESHELFDSESCGVVVVDRVEEDGLYPYTPQERQRMDVNIVIVLRPHWRAKPGDEGGEKELVVSLSLGKFVRLHRSDYPLAPSDVRKKLCENIMDWGDVMITAMREILSQNPR